MFTGQILSGDWGKGILEIEDMPADFVLSARKLVVMEEGEFADLVAERDKWISAYEEDDIRTNGQCDKIKHLTYENAILKKAIQKHLDTDDVYHLEPVLEAPAAPEREIINNH